ncbi:MAG: helix-turn-helix transcriptional regulator [Magnetococcales bacterium]|nr:helix-turn-helix transcriptional regulator [Magnetococcales bacterium]
MDADRYDPVPHDEAFVARVLSNPAVKSAYDALEEEYSAISAFLDARKSAGLTQDEIASRMGTTKSAISRLESSLGNGKMSPSLATLRRYAAAVGCRLELKLLPR